MTVAIYNPAPVDKLGEKENKKSQYFIDVRSRVPEGRHAECAKALGAFAQQLHPLVVLHKAEVPVS